MINYIFLLSLILVRTYAQHQNQCYKFNMQQKTPLGKSNQLMDNFQSGHHILLNNKQKRYHCFNIPLKQNYFSSNYNYGVAISMKDIQNYSNEQGFDFSIRVSKNSSLFEGIFVVSDSLKWTKIQIYYLVSSRQDIRLGSFIGDTSNIMSCNSTNNKSITLKYYFEEKWKASKKYLFTIPFISGIKTLDPQTKILLIYKNYNPYHNLLKISLSIYNTVQPLEMIYLSYMIFTMDSSFNVWPIYNINNIPQTQHVFIGVVGSSQTNRLLGADYNQNFHKYFTVLGVIITNEQYSGNFLSYTNQTYLKCFSKSKCKKYGGYMKFDDNNPNHLFISQCLLCQKHEKYNTTSQKCQCQSGFFFVNKTCIQNKILCSTHQIYDQSAQKCICKNNYVQKDGNCTLLQQVCPQGIYFKDQCIKVVYHDTTQYKTVPCSQNQIKINSICHPKKKCKNNQILNQRINQCQCLPYQHLYHNFCVTCRSNQVWKQQKCVCDDNANKYKGRCVYCHISAFWNGKQCVCGHGYVGNGFICRHSHYYNLSYPGSTTHQQLDKYKKNLGKLN